MSILSKRLREEGLLVAREVGGCCLKGAKIALRLLPLLSWVVGQMLKPKWEISWEDKL